mgnify:CR=1 FL=1
MPANETFDLHVPGLSKAIDEMDVEIAERNATIQYQDEGVDVGTKGGIQYINFTGSGVALDEPSAGVLEVIVSGGGSGLSQPQVMARTLGC